MLLKIFNSGIIRCSNHIDNKDCEKVNSFLKLGTIINYFTKKVPVDILFKYGKVEFFVDLPDKSYSKEAMAAISKTAAQKFISTISILLSIDQLKDINFYKKTFRKIRRKIAKHSKLVNKVILENTKSKPLSLKRLFFYLNFKNLNGVRGNNFIKISFVDLLKYIKNPIKEISKVYNNEILLKQPWIKSGKLTLFIKFLIERHDQRISKILDKNNNKQGDKKIQQLQIEYPNYNKNENCE